MVISCFFISSVHFRGLLFFHFCLVLAHAPVPMIVYKHPEAARFGRSESTESTIVLFAQQIIGPAEPPTRINE
jgi:dihydrodipicolinate synthase/N-acetylneuraminate lyase